MLICLRFIAGKCQVANPAAWFHIHVMINRMIYCLLPLNELICVKGLECSVCYMRSAVPAAACLFSPPPNPSPHPSSSFSSTFSCSFTLL